jgi:phosphoserine phosphatase
MENNLEILRKDIIRSIKKTEPPVFAVFDFDNTCIINDITEAALSYMAVNNLFRDKNFLEGSFDNYSQAVFENYYKLLDCDKIKDAYEFISKILSGFSVNEIGSLVDKIIEFEGDKISTTEIWGRKVMKGIKSRKQVVELIDFLRNNMVEVWIVSASPEMFVREAMRYFKIKANLIGVRNSVVDGKTTSELEKPMSMFEGKVDCIKKFINSKKRPLFGVGDSINDLPMLEYCEIKAVVDRQNLLAKKAKQNGWFLI